MWMRSLLLPAVIGLVVCPPSRSAGAAPFKVGTLVCAGDARIGWVVGSRQSFRCTFRARPSSNRFIYEGTIRRAGIDIGFSPVGSLSWTVLARNSQIGRGTLRGHYVGISASAAFGPGLGANLLIGGSRRTVVLQPISIERQIGINLAAGVATLTLR